MSREFEEEVTVSYISMYTMIRDFLNMMNTVLSILFKKRSEAVASTIAENYRRTNISKIDELISLTYATFNKLIYELPEYREVAGKKELYDYFKEDLELLKKKAEELNPTAATQVFHAQYIEYKNKLSEIVKKADKFLKTRPP